jgi:hypothetical protein
MKALNQEWSKADGELAFVIARKMVWALLLNPDAFYEEFSPDTANYARFTEDLDDLVFWNPVDTTTGYLERLRIVTIERLSEQTYSISEKNRHLHENMIDKLRHVEVTHVD